jgi:hypothetical protein
LYFLRNNWFCGVRGKVRCQRGAREAPLLLEYNFIFNCYSKLMQILSGDSLLLHTPSLFNSKVMQILSGDALLHQYTFLIQFLFKTDENPLWRPPPPPVHIPYSILNQN